MPPCPSTLGVGAKSHVPVITPATTPFRPEHSIAKMLLSSRNELGGSTSPDELCHKKLHHTWRNVAALYVFRIAKPGVKSFRGDKVACDLRSFDAPTWAQAAPLGFSGYSG
ncbi:jg12954 [Pararge aegeria aegeria]|uniref:Jg12954 protein n=1 Tax=Pararge aegeria aegeria TaxID=348720 RepID=A0A8S4QSX6_9NEOP|nr:jg12954 [Pararge aegeria aegeria]